MSSTDRGSALRQIMADAKRETDRRIEERGAAFIGGIALLADEDQRPQQRGWAPGRYLCSCRWCSKYFLGDKRAIQCADCAYAS